MSTDGYNLYLIFFNRVTRYIWIFLTSSKTPPITIAQKILNKFKYKYAYRTIRTDQGGELGLSHEFQNIISEEGFNLKVTRVDALAQNTIAESPMSIG